MWRKEGPAGVPGESVDVKVGGGQDTVVTGQGAAGWCEARQWTGVSILQKVRIFSAPNNSKVRIFCHVFQGYWLL